MTGNDPVQRPWPDPETDLRAYFGRSVPTFSARTLLAMSGLFLLGMLAVVTLLELAA